MHQTLQQPRFPPFRPFLRPQRSTFNADYLESHLKKDNLWLTATWTRRQKDARELRPHSPLASESLVHCSVPVLGYPYHSCQRSNGAENMSYREPVDPTISRLSTVLSLAPIPSNLLAETPPSFSTNPSFTVVLSLLLRNWLSPSKYDSKYLSSEG